MSNKFVYFAGIFIGGLIGGWIPSLWGSDSFSLSSILFNFVGGVVGLWVSYYIVKNYL